MSNSILSGTYGTYKLTSQCIDKVQVELEITAIAGSLAVSALPVGETKSDVTFYDNNKSINSNGLNGAWGGGSGSAISGTANSGRVIGSTALGEAVTNIEAGKTEGTTNASLGAFLGKVISMKKSWVYCGTNEKPKCGPSGCFKVIKEKNNLNPAQISRPTVKSITPEALPPSPPTSGPYNFDIKW